MICDLAQTYHIYDYKKLPPQKVAILVLGLSDDSRIMMKLAKQSYDLKTIMLVGMFDRLNWLCWTKSNNASKGIGMPRQILQMILPKETDSIGFNTGEAFNKKRNAILSKVKGGI